MRPSRLRGGWRSGRVWRLLLSAWFYCVRSKIETLALVRLSRRFMAGRLAEWRSAMLYAEDLLCGEFALVSSVVLRLLFSCLQRQKLLMKGVSNGK